MDSAAESLSRRLALRAPALVACLGLVGLVIGPFLGSAPDFFWRRLSDLENPAALDFPPTKSYVHVYNALERTVTVTVAGERHTVPFGATKMLKLEPTDELSVATRLADGTELESFDAKTTVGVHYVYNIAGAGLLEEYTVYYGGDVPAEVKRRFTDRWNSYDSDYVMVDWPDTLNVAADTTRTALTPYQRSDPSDLLDSLENEEHRAAIIRAHVRWTPGTSIHLNDWLSESASLPDAKRLLDGRLQADPFDVVTLLVEQDRASGKQFESVCQRHRKLAASAPERVELLFVTAQCAPTRAGLRKALGELHEQHPKNAWIALGHGFEQSSIQRWDEAIAALEIARTGAPAWRDEVSLRLARLLRLRRPATPDLDRRLDELAEDSPRLKWLRHAERTTQEDEVQEGFRQLAKGRVEMAAGIAGKGADGAKALMFFAAASDGAPPSAVDYALAERPDTTDAQTVWFALALAARKKADLEPYRGPFLKHYSRSLWGQALDFADDPDLRDDPELAEELVMGVRPETQARILSMLCTIHGSRAPLRWRIMVNRLLFGVERPYFAEVPPPK